MVICGLCICCCRAVRYDEHWTKNNCFQLCQTHEARACNVEACPIHCQLTEFGPWSECSPCAKKSVSKTHTAIWIFKQKLGSLNLTGLANVMQQQHNSIGTFHWFSLFLHSRQTIYAFIHTNKLFRKSFKRFR